MNSTLRVLFGFALGTALLTGPIAVLADDDDESKSSSLSIEKASWKASKKRLKIEAKGRFSSAYAGPSEVSILSGNNVLLDTRLVRIEDDGKWELETNLSLNAPPCRLKVVADDAQDTRRVRRASSNCDDGTSPTVNQPPVANAGPDQRIQLLQGTSSVRVTLSAAASTDPDGEIRSYVWIGTPNPSNSINPVVDLEVGNYEFVLRVADDLGLQSETDRVSIQVFAANTPPPSDTDISINSTAQGCGQGDATGTIECLSQAVAEPVVPNSDNSNNPAPGTGDGAHQIIAINDLGMHCGDLDTRISSILPPFQVLLAQVIRKGSEPEILAPHETQLYYSAASNPNDPILNDPKAFSGLTADGSTFKTNFWESPIPGGAYDAFYPAANPFDSSQTITPLAGAPFNVGVDQGLPVPNVEDLYIGPDGEVNSGDESLHAVQQDMPGVQGPHTANDAQRVHEHLQDKPFFPTFPFGYIAEDVNWFEGAGIPFAAYDDFGRANPYPLVSVQARSNSGTPLATVQTVLPISGEASCKNCHAASGEIDDLRTEAPTQALTDAGLPVASQVDDPDNNVLPIDVSVEYATDINVLRLHDLKHGANYVDTDHMPNPCDIKANDGDGDTSCLTNQALVQGKPVVCQVCHYTPALDLAQLGPLAGAVGTLANGRNQLAHKSNSNVMHSHHGQFTELFPDMPAPVQADDGTITNQTQRLDVLDKTCYQCHPGKSAQCLRGAMFNGGMLCNDCHGDMAAVGNDFSAKVSPSDVGSFELGMGNFYDPSSSQPRVPWANEPGCGSCHTGDAVNNALSIDNDGVDPAQVIVNKVDQKGITDGIRLRRAFRSGDPKATPIVPVNTRFAENPIPDSFNGFDNPGAGNVGNTAARNPKLYRVSTGHGGVFCEGCHGATHAEWPNANPFANDNVTSDQLQGHTGSIGECKTCHTGNLGLTLDGPHGMHPVGESRWNDSHKQLQEERGPAVCKACHGVDGRGTVLSRTFADRTFDCKDDGTLCRDSDDRISVPAGTPIGCVECHENYINGDD